MYYKYFIDFLGTLTILYSKIYTDANPPIMGLVYFAMFYLGKGVTEGFFSPLAVFVQYSLGRINATESMICAYPSLNIKFENHTSLKVCFITPCMTRI